MRFIIPHGGTVFLFMLFLFRFVYAFLDYKAYFITVFYIVLDPILTL